MYKILATIAIIGLIGLQVETRIELHHLKKYTQDLPSGEIFRKRAYYVNYQIENLDRRLYYLSITEEHPWYLGKTTEEIDSVLSLYYR